MKKNTLRLFKYGFLAAICLLNFSLVAAGPLTAHAQGVQDYVVCGSEVQTANFQTGENWTSVHNGEYVYDPAGYTGSLVSYTGPAGYQVDPNNTCSGVYYWGWNYGAYQATWTYHNASLPPGYGCKIVVFTPSWYAGAPDAIYTLSTSFTNWSFSFPAHNQDQAAAGWYWLTDSNNVPVVSPEIPAFNSDLNLTLRSYGSHTFYMAADAVRFICSPLH